MYGRDINDSWPLVSVAGCPMPNTRSSTKTEYILPHLNLNDIPWALRRLVSSTLTSHKHIANNNRSRFPRCSWYAVRTLGIILECDHFLAWFWRMGLLYGYHDGAAGMHVGNVGGRSTWWLHGQRNVTHTRQIELANAPWHKVFNVTFQRSG